MMLPWHAAGTLDPCQTRRVDEALARDAALARQYEAIQQEYAETIRLNESLGVPSLRVKRRLFDAIDAEATGDLDRRNLRYAWLAGSDRTPRHRDG
jgi:anti-sigma factor RsiW